MRFEPKKFDPKDRDGACTCTGEPREAHDPECPVRKAHPRLDLGDAPLEHTPLSTRLDALRIRVARGAVLTAGRSAATQDRELDELHAVVAELVRVVEDLEKRTAPKPP